MKCSIEGCKNESARRSWCYKHYKRWQTYSDPMHVKNPRIYGMTLQERILATIKKVGDCWIWQGSISNRGIPRLKYKSKTTSAHRAAYIAFKGPVPDKLLVCHTCDNPLCVNPEHLYSGTALDNVRDRTERTGIDHVPKGLPHWNAKFSDKQILEVLKATGLHRIIAKKYGMSRGYVSQLKSKKGAKCRAAARKQGMIV